MADIKIALILLALAAGMASAESVLVYGNVDDGKVPVSGIPYANVTIVCGNESSNITADFKGAYLGTLNCTENAIINVTAQQGNLTGSNSGKSDGYGQAAINVIIQGAQGAGPCISDTGGCSVQIPEFPTTAAPVLLSMLSFGILRLRKR